MNDRNEYEQLNESESKEFSFICSQSFDTGSTANDAKLKEEPMTAQTDEPMETAASTQHEIC